MKERPILFSGPMVQAILTGKKTQTRRVAIKTSQPRNVYISDFDAAEVKIEIENKHSGQRYWKQCPYGQAGDRLWVREAWAQPTSLDPGPTFYRADYPYCVPRHFENVPPADKIKWKPSIHMPRRACRILLEVVSVRIERVNDISEADCIAEGCAGGHGSIPGYGYAATPYEHYRHLWESINGPGSWADNPWVWVVEFKRVKP